MTERRFLNGAVIPEATGAYVAAKHAEAIVIDTMRAEAGEIAVKSTYDIGEKLILGAYAGDVASSTNIKAHTSPVEIGTGEYYLAGNLVRVEGLDGQLHTEFGDIDVKVVSGNDGTPADNDMTLYRFGMKSSITDESQTYTLSAAGTRITGTKMFDTDTRFNAATTVKIIAKELGKPATP